MVLHQSISLFFRNNNLLFCLRILARRHVSYFKLLNFFRLADKTKKINVSLVISIQAGTAVILSSLIIYFFDMGPMWGSLNSGDLIVGGLNFVTMFCSNYSIKFVNYPFMVLAKSAKVLPVVLTGWLLRVYKITKV